MATSSITKNFVVSGGRQVEKFANAIEASATSKTPVSRVAVKQLRGTSEIKQFLAKRKNTNE